MYYEKRINLAKINKDLDLSAAALNSVFSSASASASASIGSSSGSGGSSIGSYVDDGSVNFSSIAGAGAGTGTSSGRKRKVSSLIGEVQAVVYCAHGNKRGHCRSCYDEYISLSLLPSNPPNPELSWPSQSQSQSHVQALVLPEESESKMEIVEK